MEFDENKPIYLQISDRFCDDILSGKLKPEDRIPSVREWGASIGVNPNTVARSYDVLSDMGVISNKRGIGFFVSATAREIVLEQQKKKFLEEELPRIVQKAEWLGLDLKSILEPLKK